MSDKEIYDIFKQIITLIDEIKKLSSEEEIDYK